ncbi:hypothetical protein [Actinoplanes philippinensis]|uniref:hypothetical protein n=1 Tax=Actinoplanes philippinensis TaxID=35752 RepID=UPI00340EB9D0
MFRYYVSYMFQEGYGVLDISTQTPITEQNDLGQVRELINEANGRILPGLLIMSFSRYGSKQPNPQRNSADTRAPRGR